MCYNLKKSQDHDHVNITQSKYFRGQLLNHDKQEEFWCFWQKWRSVQVLMCSISLKTNILTLIWCLWVHFYVFNGLLTWRKNNILKNFLAFWKTPTRWYSYPKYFNALAFKLAWRYYNNASMPIKGKWQDLTRVSFQSKSRVFFSRIGARF